MGNRVLDIIYIRVHLRSAAKKPIALAEAGRSTDKKPAPPLPTMRAIRARNDGPNCAVVTACVPCVTGRQTIRAKKGFSRDTYKNRS